MCRPPGILAKARLRMARRNVPATFVGCVYGSGLTIAVGQAASLFFHGQAGSLSYKNRQIGVIQGINMVKRWVNVDDSLCFAGALLQRHQRKRRMRKQNVCYAPFMLLLE